MDFHSERRWKTVLSRLTLMSIASQLVFQIFPETTSKITTSIEAILPGEQVESELQKFTI